MAKAKKVNRKGFIVKWKTATSWFVHVLHNNGNITDSNRYKTAAGRNKKVKRLLEMNPSHQVVTKAELKLIQKAKRK